MPVLDGTSTVWVVLDESGRVLVMASGAGAHEFAIEQAGHDRRVVELGSDEVRAA